MKQKNHHHHKPHKKRFKKRHKPFQATLYTDASFREGQGSWAYWIRSGKGRIINSGPCPRDVQTSNQAELYAVYMALETIKKELPKTLGILLNSDSLLACDKTPLGSSPIQGASKKWQKEIHRLIKEQTWQYRTRHIKAHQKVRCTRTFINSQVDELAKKALPTEVKASIWTKLYGKIMKWWYGLKKPRKTNYW